MLKDLGVYLNGLDNIVMGAGSGDDQSVTLQTDASICHKPIYGHLIIALNKMMGDSPDHELEQELMTPRPGKNICLTRLIEGNLFFFRLWRSGGHGTEPDPGQDESLL